MAGIRTFETGVLRDLVYQHFIQWHMHDHYSSNVKHQICARAIPHVQVCPFNAFIMNVKMCVQGERNTRTICAFYAFLGAFVKLRKATIA